jgi:hypothetical protein
MNIDEFRVIDEKGRKADPFLYESSYTDARATEESLADLERVIGVRLPTTYRTFLQEFGGGYVGSAVVFSADPSSDWFLPAKLLETREYLPSHTIPFSDDFCGGFYVFEFKDGQCNEVVKYYHFDGGLISTKYSNVLDCLADIAY